MAQLYRRRQMPFALEDGTSFGSLSGEGHKKRLSMENKRWLSMERSELELSKSRCAKRSHPWLEVLLEAIDSRLRRRLEVSEYTQSPDCLLRIQIVRNADEALLRDGTCLRPGDRIIELHFWNEQVPLMSDAGPTLSWARGMRDSFRRSLQELALHLAARTDMDDIRAVRAIAALGTDARADQISRILSRFGFEVVPQQKARSVAQHFRRYGENILISLMVLAYNESALRPDTLNRGRVPAYLSRRALDERYGVTAKTARRTAQRQPLELHAPAGPVGHGCPPAGSVATMQSGASGCAVATASPP